MPPNQYCKTVQTQLCCDKCFWVTGKSKERDAGEWCDGIIQREHVTLKCMTPPTCYFITHNCKLSTVSRSVLRLNWHFHKSAATGQEARNASSLASDVWLQCLKETKARSFGKGRGFISAAKVAAIHLITVVLTLLFWDENTEKRCRLLPTLFGLLWQWACKKFPWMKSIRRTTTVIYRNIPTIMGDK